MRCKLIIPGLLPGLNEYIDAERGKKGKYKAASMKKKAEHVIGFMIKFQLRGVKFKGPVVIHYTWVEPNRRRDKDNIAFAKKFVQDSLVQMGVLENDGWKHIEYFTDSFAVDPKNPRVEVAIEDYEGGKPFKNIPAIEIKRGKWTHGINENFRTCSACNISMGLSEGENLLRFKYCPFCGAKMEVEQ